MAHSLLPYSYLSHALPYVSRQSLLYILCQRRRRTSLRLHCLLIYLLAPKSLTCKHLLSHKTKYTTSPCTNNQIVSAWAIATTPLSLPHSLLDHVVRVGGSLHYCNVWDSYKSLTRRAATPVLDIQEPFPGEGQSVQVLNPTHFHYPDLR